MPAPHSTPDAPKERRTQDVANEAWPQYDPKIGHHARDLVDRPDPRPVWIRVEWVHDGEEVIAAMAHRWTDEYSHVFCRWVAPRLPINGLWVRARDVRPRDPGD